MIGLLMGILAALACAYCAVVLSASVGFRRILSRRVAIQKEIPPLTVVIAARNEADRIEACLTSIAMNDVPKDSFEIIVIDDASNDDTRERVEVLAGHLRVTGPTIRVLRNEKGHGKGPALEAGIRAARGEIIVTTDADCTVPVGWLRSMAAHFAPDVGFVAGPVANARRCGTREEVEDLEFLALVGFGAGTIGIGHPTICNSANAAYRRHLFLEWRDGSGASGLAADDELIMHYIHDKTPFRVDFCASVDAVVETHGTTSLADFHRQRSRWASSLFSFPIRVLLLSTVIFAFFGALAFATAVAFANPSAIVATALAFFVKAAVDVALIIPVCRHFGRPSLIRRVPIAELLHVPYVLSAAPVGLIGKTRWKGREVRRDRRRRGRKSSTPIAALND